MAKTKRLSAELEAAQAVWYAKLKATGFVDIEPTRATDDANYITDHWIDTKRHAESGNRQAIPSMFEALSGRIDTLRFHSLKHRWWIVCYCAGMVPREIVARVPGTWQSMVTVSKHLHALERTAVAKAYADGDFDDDQMDGKEDL